MIGLADELPAPCHDHLHYQTMPELWQPIKGYEGLYEVSDQGRVRSLERKVPHKERLITVKAKVLRQSFTGPKGYEYMGVTLSRQGKVTTKRVHILVADAFLERPADYGTEVNHKDCDKLNNVVSNLEFMTHKENQQHAAANGRMGHDGWKHKTRDPYGRFN